MGNLDTETTICTMNQRLEHRIASATTIEQVLELEDDFCNLVRIVVNYVYSAIEESFHKVKGRQLILDNLISTLKQECSEAKTLNDLSIIKSKYLGKNSIIAKMEKENAQWYKEQKQKELK